MQQRNVGSSGLRVSLVGLGCNNFGGRIDEEASRVVIRKALDLGITLFDTADVYGNRGGSETCLGRYLGARRNDIVLASKFGLPMDDDGPKRGGSRRYIMAAVEDSLKRLQTEWIDLYQLHRPDPLTPLEETMRALDDLVHQGKIRYIGFSQPPAWTLVATQWTARHHGLNPLIACEYEYSLLARGAEREHVPAMQAYGMGLLPFYPLAAGFLTGKFKRGTPIPEGIRLSPSTRYGQKFVTDANWSIIERLEEFCRLRGHTLLELAFSWLAAQPVIPSIIAGATKPEQLVMNVKATEWKLDSTELAEIDRMTS